MSLSPELRRYVQQEGIDTHVLARDISEANKQHGRERRQRYKDRFKTIWNLTKKPVEIFSHVERVDRDDVQAVVERKKEKKQRRREKKTEIIFKTSEKISQTMLNGYFDGLTWIRCHTPGAIGLTAWEKRAVKDFKITEEDLKKPETWRKLKEEGRDARGLFIKDLQDSHVVPERDLLQLADQATTKANRKSLLAFDQNIKKHLGRYLDHVYHEVFMEGMTKSFLAAVPQHPGYDTTSALIIGGGLSTYIASKLNTGGYLGNNLERMGGEFASLLRIHYKTYRRAVARSPQNAEDKKRAVFSASQIDEIGRRIFTGSRFVFEGIIQKKKSATTLTGLGLVHALNVVTAGSLPKAAVRVGESAFAFASGYYLYRKIHQEKRGLAAQEYDSLQRAYLAAIDEESKRIAAQEGRGVNSDWFENTTIPNKREALAERLHASTTRTQIPIELTPWGVAFGTTSLNEAVLIDEFSAANALVTAGVMVGGLRPLVHEFTWHRQNTVRRDEVERLELFINAIYESKHHIPTYLEEEKAKELRGLPTMSSRQEALALMAGEPLIIRQVDLGQRERSVAIKEAIHLMPGTVSFIRAPKGTGKNEFARMIIHEQGSIETKDNYDVSKGIDLLQVPSELSLLALNEATFVEQEQTIAEQIVKFIISPEDNLFKEEIRKLKDDINHFKTFSYVHGDPYPLTQPLSFTMENWLYIGVQYGKEQRNQLIDRLLSDDPERESWLQAWSTNPASGRNIRAHEPEDKIASALLTVAATNYLAKIFNNISTPQQAVEYLTSIPGPASGTSAGEGSLWQTRELLTQELAVGILDEPTAHVGGKAFIDHLFDEIGGVETIFDDSYARVANLVEDYLTNFPNAILLIIEHDGKLKQELQAKSILSVRNGGRRLVDKEIIPVAEKSMDYHTVWQAKQLKSL